MRLEDEIPPIDLSRLRWDSAPKSLLGQGSFGMVYKGKWNGTPVAIKVVKPARGGAHSEEYEAAESAAMKQHRREIHRLMVVHNPFIIQYLAVFRGATPRDLYIVTEFLEGGSLFDSLTKMRARQAVLDHRSFLQLANHMACGLNHVHFQQYTHGDMKPQNVLLTAAMTFDESCPSRITAFVPSTAKAKIADFGLSKRLQGAGPTAFQDSTTATSDFGSGPCGTFLYMSPEAYEGVSHLSDEQAKAADVYAYGLILFELLSGIQSWEVENARNPMQLGMWVRQGQRPSWGKRKHSVKKEFSSLVERCWSHNPHDRPTFDEIVAELEALEGKLDESGCLPNFDHYPSLEAADNASQPGKFEEQHAAETGQVDAPSCHTDPNCNPDPPVPDAPFLSDSFFAGIGSEASYGPPIRRVSSMRLTDTVGTNASIQRPPDPLPLVHRPSFNESHSSHRFFGPEEPHSLSQVHRSDATLLQDGTGVIYRNNFGLVDQQGEIDGSVIGGVPVKRVQSTYNVSTPQVEPLQFSTNNDYRPTMGLGSFANGDPRRGNPRRSDGELFSSWFGVPLDPCCAPHRADVNNPNGNHPQGIPSHPTETPLVNPPVTMHNSNAQMGAGPASSGTTIVQKAGAADTHFISGRDAQNRDHLKPLMQFPHASDASAVHGSLHYGDTLPVPTAGNLAVGPSAKSGVPAGSEPGTRIHGAALASKSTSGSAMGPLLSHISLAPMLENPTGLPIDPRRDGLQASGGDYGDSELPNWRTNPYGSGPLPTGYIPMKTSPLNSPMDTNTVRLALQRPDGRDHIMRLWNHGHLHTVAGGLAHARNLRGGEMLRLACDFLKQSTQLPPGKLQPVVSRDLCTCIGTIVRNDSNTLCPEVVLMAVRVALSSLYTHYPTFVQNDTSSVEAYVACNFALCNLFRVYNVIRDASFRAEIAEWISFTISRNVHEGSVHEGSTPGPFSEALAYASTSAARNFMWMNKANLTEFTSQGRGGGRRPTSPLLWSVSYFDWVGSAPVVETSLSALAMIIHLPKQREDFTKHQGLKRLTDVLGKHKTNLRVAKLVFATIAMLLREMRDGGDHLDVIRRGFLFDDGCQRLVSALNDVKGIPADPKLVASTLLAGFDALQAAAALCDELRPQVARCGAITSMQTISTWLLSYEMQHFRDPNDSEMYFVFTMLGKSMFALAREISEDSASAHLLESSGALASLEELNYIIDNR